MPGPIKAGELAARRKFALPDGHEFHTPLLIPSFSSKGFPQIDKIVRTTGESITDPILVSAYDISYKKIQADLSFAPLIFLDSGGYEASKDVELSDISDNEYFPRDWTNKLHTEVLDTWGPGAAKVLISYDHPDERVPVADQIERARELAIGRGNAIPELLLKPESSKSVRLKVDSIRPHVHRLADFPIIGVTEKEIGNSLLDRMENIARLRMALSAAGLNIPIHIFGSLDTISTQLYFLAGADIFDGLTWLRFAYYDGLTIYRHNYGALKMGEAENSDIVEAATWSDNYRYMKRMEREMKRFTRQQSFDCFEFHRAMSQRALDSILAELEDH